MGLVVPAVLPSSRKELEEGLALLIRIPSVSRVQIDVVDGRFASPASWPYTSSTGSPQAAPGEFRDMIKRGEMLPYLDRLEYEIDLMCLDSEHVAAAWLALGATRLTFHAESAIDLPRLLMSARKRYGAGGFTSLVSFGIALNIGSDLSLIEPCLGEIEYVQFMGIARIGRQGQLFDRRVLEKMRMFKMRHPKMPVQVDGGISFENAKNLLALGVSNLVIGSNIARAEDPAEAIAKFEELQSPYGV